MKLCGNTPQNVTIAEKCNTNAKCNNINAKCSKVINAKCNNFPAQNVISFMTQNVITQTVITPQLQVCLTWSIFFSTRTSEQHTATADLVNFFIISYRFRLNIQTSSGSLNKIVLELILWLMVIVQITFQQGCELQKHPQKHNVQVDKSPV